MPFSCRGRKPAIAWAVQMQTSLKHVIGIRNANLRSTDSARATFCPEAESCFSSSTAQLAVDGDFTSEFWYILFRDVYKWKFIARGAKALLCFDNRRSEYCVVITSF